MAARASRRQTLWIRQSIREIISDFSVYDTEGRITDLDVAEGYKPEIRNVVTRNACFTNQWGT